MSCGVGRKQHVGIGDNSPREGDALLLAAGQFGGCMIPPILQTYFFQRRHAGSMPRGPVLPTIEEGKFDILKRSGPREQVEALEAKAKRFTTAQPQRVPLPICSTTTQNARVGDGGGRKV